ncbi:MAG TPA: hypothetical protein VJ816_11810 [Gemmatimonadales bacterium]|nr:hypothetical protein [Gemmatimonadales bacterium]
MFPLSPILAATLVAAAVLLASRLPIPDPIARGLHWGTTVTSLGWYLLGVLLGPGLGLLDRDALAACAPLLTVAIGWVAARAGAELARPEAELTPWSMPRALEAIGAFLVPAALLAGAARWLMVPSIEQWKVIAPAIVTLAAAVALAGTGNPRRVLFGSFILALTALVALLLPHPSRTEVKRLVIALAIAIGGAGMCAAIAARLVRRASILPETIAALCLAAGIGAVSRVSSLVVCGVVGFTLARRSLPHEHLAAELRIHEPVAAAIVWLFAGAMLGGSLAVVGLATGLVALWPMGRRLIGGATEIDSTLGLAIAMGFALTAGAGLGDWTRAVPTIVALGFLLVRVIPTTRAVEPLTPPARPVEVSA